MRVQDIGYTPSPKFELDHLVDDVRRYQSLAAEFGRAEEADRIVAATREALEQKLADFDELVSTAPAEPDEPETLADIHEARPQGERRLLAEVPEDYLSRWRGSLLGRGAGCTLGAAVEFWSVDQMEAWGRQFDEEYPPTDFFSFARLPGSPRYIVGNTDDLRRGRMQYIPVDDDTAYTLIGLLTLEEHGPEFTPEQQAATWQRNFPIHSEENGSWGVFWGERRFLQNLQQGIEPRRAGRHRNPNVQSIAAWTRADAWGYAAPGWPEKAAELAFKDASLNHRRNGVYGTMFMAAAVSAAFAVDEPAEALEIALQEIPKESLLAEGVRWAFDVSSQVSDYRDAARLVSERYPHMFEGHAINNALYVVFGILLGGRDFTRVVGETVAMGNDNDCTSATAASIVGATIGLENVPAHWTEPFQGRMQNYLRDLPEFLEVDDIGERFVRQAKEVLGRS
ncbi:ADP-ribosylglycohydrolase family protein [Microbacterium betulae]|uniref:ADP-ribosylglycohydrolase family protein n=1 Tax=Microbacterium betulae TaxID=2981139 RepID=A0AA97FGS1_9MICO|nr:ADP-ribosylglycohydrolase family protein [Microbacterium sp. AB]WOF22383.1 ADP-ribosylglycohydrolase family protein [Microbacterium sp. AB]